MNKKIFISVIFLSISFYIKAQYDVSRETPIDKYEILDSAYIECLYELHYLKNTEKRDNVSEDVKVLQIGKQISKFYSLYVLKHDSLCQDLRKKGGSFIPNNSKSGAQGYEIFKNYPQGKITYTDKGTCLGGSFIYEENIPDLAWKILPDKMVLLDHPCQKATSSFRGRDYEAWFTMDIPISNGPWKFGGLPGLILKVQDLQHHFVFECISIRSLKVKQPVLLYQIEYIKTKRDELSRLYKKYHDNPTAYEESLGKELLFMGKDGVARVNRQAKFPYNPIELE
jgi:GLPGLI family protein